MRLALIGAYTGPAKNHCPIIKYCRAANIALDTFYIPPPPASPNGSSQHWAFLWQNWWRQQRHTKQLPQQDRYDAYIVAWPSFYDIRWVKGLAERFHKPLLYYAFFSYFEAYATDRHYHKNNLLDRYRFWLWRRADRAVAQADQIILDTQAHIDYFTSRYKLPPSKFSRLWVGSNLPRANDEPSPIPTTSGKTRLLYFGYFVPLHGTNIILQAAKLLADRSDLEFIMIGKGQDLNKSRQFLAKHDLHNVIIEEPLTKQGLANLIKTADIGLGVFGSSPKTQRVVPFKVFDLLKAGRPIITADTPAIRELLTPNRDAVLCSTGQPDALAQAITKLAGDPAWRQQLSQQARTLYETKLTDTKIGTRLQHIVNKTLEDFPTSP